MNFIKNKEFDVSENSFSNVFIPYIYPNFIDNESKWFDGWKDKKFKFWMKT